MKITRAFILTVMTLLAGVAAAQVRPTLGIARSNNQVVLSWSTNVSNFFLQAATNLSGSNWSTGSNLAPTITGTNFRVQVTATGKTQFYRLNNTNVSSGSGFDLVLIPAGSFTMGNTTDINEGYSNEVPSHVVTVSAFYMSSNLVSYSQWQQVYNWAITHGYSFDNAGSGKSNSHPVQTISPYDTWKWCNARSEMEGRTPAYYTNAQQTVVYRSGRIDLASTAVNWNAGYRLPTEAEWERAARGGLTAQRFPLGNTISWSQANYYGDPKTQDPNGSAYDMATAVGYDPAFNVGNAPLTSPVGVLQPNAYGLYDMAGNVFEFCWDYYGSYTSSSQTDPRGPTVGTYRVTRGGSWNVFALMCRTSFRGYGLPTDSANSGGFRCVLPSN